MSGGEPGYYAALGVPEDASAEAIEGAYRERVKEVHPDRSDAPDATEQFRLVQEAKEVLTDPTERARYDRLGHAAYVRRNAGPGAVPGDGSRANSPTDPPRTERRSAGGAERTGGRGRSRDRSRGRSAGGGGPRDRRRARSGHSGAGADAQRDDDGTADDDSSADWATDGARRDRHTTPPGEPGRDDGGPGRDEAGSRRSHDRAPGDPFEGATAGAQERGRVWRRQGPRGRRRDSERARARERARRRARAASPNRAGDGPSYHAAADYATGWYSSGADSDAGYGVSPGSGPVFVSERVGLAAMAFVLYPLFAFGAFVPSLAPGARLALGLLGLTLVGYLVSTPEAGLLAFGAWTLLAPFVLVAADVGVVSLAGTLAWAACWLPFLFCAASLLFRYR